MLWFVSKTQTFSCILIAHNIALHYLKQVRGTGKKHIVRERSCHTVSCSSPEHFEKIGQN